MPKYVSCDLLRHRLFTQTNVFFIELKLFQIKQTLVLCEWFVDDKLSIHFWEDKQETKGFKRQLDTKRGIQIKQHPYVKYLGCVK